MEQEIRCTMHMPQMDETANGLGNEKKTAANIKPISSHRG